MTAPIQTNKPVFFDKNGEVLKNGYIYIGQPNQDPVPVANRKTVTFQDSGGSQFTAAQPLRTGTSGQIVNPATGKAIIALVDGNYSMLTQNVNGQQQDFIPLIEEATGGGTSSNSVVYASLLADLKQINVTPGQYVENIGKTSALDKEGARWLVVSNTGNPADDVDLIDFNNGTQGQRVENQLYSIKNLQEIEDAGSSAQAEARENIDVYSTAQVDGFFGNFEVLWTGSLASDTFNFTTQLSGYPGEGIYIIEVDTPVATTLTHFIQIYVPAQGSSSIDNRTLLLNSNAYIGTTLSFVRTRTDDTEITFREIAYDGNMSSSGGGFTILSFRKFGPP